MSVPFAKLNLALLALQESIFDDGLWLPGRHSIGAGAIDYLFYFILGICAFFFGLIIILMVLFVIRYRHRPGREEAEETAHHNLPLEITWSVIPLILVIVIFAFGYKAYLDSAVAPPDSMEFMVTGQKWKWMFEYPDGTVVPDELIVPAGKPVKLVMTSDDVIHSFYVPDFRIKRDVVPGRYTSIWFQTEEPGEHTVFCAEYCGTEHSSMLARIVVVPEVEYEIALEKLEAMYDEMAPAEAGFEMYKRYGCVQCHTNDGVAGTGPTFMGIFGETHKLDDGSEVLVDENYIHDSILDPMGQIRDGFQGVMPTYQGKVKEKHIRWLIAYIKQLSGVETVVEEEPTEGESAEGEQADDPAGGEATDADEATADQNEETAPAEQAQVTT